MGLTQRLATAVLWMVHTCTNHSGGQIEKTVLNLGLHTLVLDNFSLVRTR